MRMWILVVVAALGCEGKKKPAATETGSGKGSEIVAAAPADAAVVAPVDAAAVAVDTAIADGATAGSSDAGVAADKLDYEHILDWETIGPFKLGMDEANVVKLVGAPKKKAFPVEEGATGEFVSGWEWPALGLTLEMASDRRTGPFHVRSIEIYPPSTYATSRGAKIGMSSAALPALYVRNLDEGREDPRDYLVGSPYGGLLITFKDGKAVSIFLGAMAF
ncbi:MAG TPA: hypothetical protein VMZ53_22000 [Kofleriaceae bacterium]|nr:hypothetical protein [Kofleriaceae bacterium]